MAQGNTQASYGPLLKQWYAKKCDDVTFIKNPLLALLPKNEAQGGSSFEQPIIFGQGQGVAALSNFATAQTMGGLTGTSSARFSITRAGSMCSATMGLEVKLSSEGDRASFMAASTQIIDGMLANRAVDLERELYGNSSGSRGQVANSSFSTNVLTLTVPDDSVRFEIGMGLQFAAAEFTGAVRAAGSSGNPVYVIGVDYEGNTISVGTTPSYLGTPVNLNDSTAGCPNIAQNDFIFRTGDRNASGVSGNTGLAPMGLGGWLPYGGPASNDSFFGVNRFTAPQRLAGVSLDGTAYSSLEECLVEFDSRVSRLGGTITHFLVPFKKFTDLKKSISAQGITLLGKSSAGVDMPQISFKGLEVMGANGPISVVPDRSCPSNRIYGINLKTWQINSLKKTINIMDEDGNVWLRQGSDSGLEVRGFSLLNLSCSNPSSNGVINVNP